jgi:Flp pilus assembly protein TadD
MDDPSIRSTAHQLDLRVLRFRTEPQREEPAMLARALLETGRHSDALELTTAGIARDPSDVDLRLVHGAALVARGRLEEAQVAFMQLAQAAPDWAHAWGELARVLLRRGRPEQALVVAERAIALEPNDTELQALRRDASLGARARRFALEPELEEPALFAQELIAAGRPAEALEVTRSALVREMDDADLLVAHARAARAIGDLDEAAGALETATFEAADWVELWQLRAAVELERGRLDEAYACIERAHRLAPESPDIAALHERIARERAHRAEVALASVIVTLAG